MATKKDLYSELMAFVVTMSAADTLSFAGIPIGTPLFTYGGLVCHRIEYFITNGSFQLMTSATDMIQLGLTGSNGLTEISPLSPEVYDYMQVYRFDAGTAASGMFEHVPIVHDFTGQPNGGLLLPAKTIYAAMVSQGLASAAQAHIRMHYTQVELKMQDYYELLQRFQLLTT